MAQPDRTPTLEKAVTGTTDDERTTQVVLDGVLEQLGGMRARQDKCLRPLVAALVKNREPMTALEMSALPAVRGISVTTLYRLLGKLDEAGFLRRLPHRSRADLLVLNLPGMRCDYLLCDRCGRAVELPVSESVLKMKNEHAAQAGWSEVKVDVDFSGLCPACRDRNASEGATTHLARLPEPSFSCREPHAFTPGLHLRP